MFGKFLELLLIIAKVVWVQSQAHGIFQKSKCALEIKYDPYLILNSNKLNFKNARNLGVVFYWPPSNYKIVWAFNKNALLFLLRAKQITEKEKKKKRKRGKPPWYLAQLDPPGPSGLG